MVRAWFMDNENNDQRLEHHRNPPKFLELDKLFKTTGVEYFSVISLLIPNADFMSIELILFLLLVECRYIQN